MATNKTQRNRIEMQLTLYKRYLKECKIQNVAKLCREIVKLENRLEVIREMNDEELKQDVQFQVVFRQSKANKLDADEIIL